MKMTNQKRKTKEKTEEETKSKRQSLSMMSVRKLEKITFLSIALLLENYAKIISF